MKWILVGIALLGLAACGGGDTPRGSCAYFHYHDYYSHDLTSIDSEGAHYAYRYHSDYVCDHYYPVPSNDHGNIPSN